MARRGAQKAAEEEEQICPLCINELDETEKAWLPCSCGYQLCLFCYDRLKTEFSNRCPNCRVEYDSDFQAGLRRRQERVAQLQREAMAAALAQRDAAKAAAAVAGAERLGGGGGAGGGRKHVQHPPPPPPPRGAPQSPASPRRDLHIDEEQLWPSLGAAATAAAHPPLPQQHHHHPRVQQQQHHHHHQQQQHGAGHTQPHQHPPQPPPQVAVRRLGSPPRLAPILPQPPGSASASTAAAEAEASSSSSADTAATTPQSPVSSVVCFRAAPPLNSAAACSMGNTVAFGAACGMGKAGGVAAATAAATAAAASTASPAGGAAGAAAVQGRVSVVLQRGSSLCVDVDPEGASLAASLQEAVRAGSLSVKQAAASLASYLRQRQAAAAASSSASSSPARASTRQPSSAGSSGGGVLTPFSVVGGPATGASQVQAPIGAVQVHHHHHHAGLGGGMLLHAEASLAPSDSMHSVATSASLSHWAPGGSMSLSLSPSSSMPLPLAQQPHPQQQLNGLLGPWQQQQQQVQAPLVGSPVRDNDKLPLFLRRGTLPPAAAAAAAAAAASSSASSGGSQHSSGASSSSAAGSFPGFPGSSSGSGSSTSELKRSMLAPPPGFGLPAGMPLGSNGLAARFQLPRFQ